MKFLCGDFFGECVLINNEFCVVMIVVVIDILCLVFNC